jgi:hypothetical protein
MRAITQVRHRDLVQSASDPELGEVAHIRTPVKIGEGVRVRESRRAQARPTQRRDLQASRGDPEGDRSAARERRDLAIDRGEAVGELV